MIFFDPHKYEDIKARNREIVDLYKEKRRKEKVKEIIRFFIALGFWVLFALFALATR